MAVDTSTERRALIGLVSRGTVPTPDSSLDESDRAALAGFYDVGVAAPVEPPPDPIPGPTSTFNPPVHYVGSRHNSRSRGPERWFFRRAAPLAVGRSVLKIDGVYQTIDTPTQAQIDSATEVYQGGHTYTVDSTTAAALTAAGYGSNLS
jgi:hypothetical protein